jgi:hypothetical protein
LSRRASFPRSPPPSSGRSPATSLCRAPKGFVVFHDRGFSGPCRMVHPRGAVRVWAPTPAPQPEQHPTDGCVRGDVGGVPRN